MKIAIPLQDCFSVGSLSEADASSTVELSGGRITSVSQLKASKKYLIYDMAREVRSPALRDEGIIYLLMPETDPKYGDSFSWAGVDLLEGF